MRVTVFGAAGNVGSRVVAEALARGHEVTAVVRNPSRAGQLPSAVTVRVADAANASDVAESIAGQDVLISATRPVPGSEAELAGTTRALLAGAARSGVRLVLVGGAGSLTVPGTDRTVLDDPDFVPPAWRPIAQACTDQLAVCRTETDADWTYLSPPARLEPGERTGAYRLGADELLLDPEGNSAISMEDLAVALLDEAERPRHHRTRFTVAY
ncbi:NAD(P)H-binding protein [Streptomyces sp. NPDC026206]|uniref:NAD(P)-dependent oxidoreductase n=1 Tax=Streptomyces sp. NPDC026206 TaxID=3157089 RepID=UPI00341077C6